MNSFSTQTFGKWILAGEHSVLRGVPALVFPLKSKSLQLEFIPKKSGLELIISEGYSSEFRLLFYSLLEKACEISGQKFSSIQGVFKFSSQIPVGSGLGASAALCASVGRFFQSQGWLKVEELVSFSRQLENIFHGESSGVDVAVSLSDVGLHFERTGPLYPLKLEWFPRCGILHSGQKGMTYDCVLKVKELIQCHPQLGANLDQQMKQAVEQAEYILTRPEQSTSVKELADVFRSASDCFQQWGLITSSMEERSKELISAGALAVKPTGSGGGGYLLALWDESGWQKMLSDSPLAAEIISCF